MRRERPDVDPRADDGLPERESPEGSERTGEGALEDEQGGVEREAPYEESAGSGVESPPRDADRAGLLP